MKQPDPQFERKVLRDVVRQMEDVDETARTQARTRRVMVTAGSVILTLALLLAIDARLDSLIIAIVAALGGIAIGFGVCLDFTIQQWPVTRKYIDMERVRKRLEELDG